jgi:hypothetical protein
MSLEISRDRNGNVTIVDKLTGKSEFVATTVVGRPEQKALGAAEQLPAHHWGQLPSQHWSHLA